MVVIYLANCRGINSKPARSSVFTKVKQIGADIMVLTETKLRAKSEIKIRKEMSQFLDLQNTYLDYNIADRAAGGVLLHFKGSALENLFEIKMSENGHFIVAAAKISGFCHLIGAYYGLSSNNDNDSNSILLDFLDMLRKFKRKYNFNRFILAGDWNICTDSGMSISGINRRCKPQSEFTLLNLVREMNVTDLWEHLKGGGIYVSRLS